MKTDSGLLMHISNVFVEALNDESVVIEVVDPTYASRSVPQTVTIPLDPTMQHPPSPRSHGSNVSLPDVTSLIYVYTRRSKSLDVTTTPSNPHSVEAHDSAALESLASLR